MKPRTRALLAELLALPQVTSGLPWRPDDVIPVTPPAGYPAWLWAPYRAGREGMLASLVRRGLLGRTADGRYCLTPAGVNLNNAGGASDGIVEKGLA